MRLLQQCIEEAPEVSVEPPSAPESFRPPSDADQIRARLQPLVPPVQLDAVTEAVCYYIATARSSLQKLRKWERTRAISA